MTIPRCCPTCGNWHTGGVCAKTVTNGVTIESGFIPAKKSYEQLERELSGAKAELSALRAAQPLTKEWLAVQIKANNESLMSHGVCYCDDCREQIGRGRLLHEIQSGATLPDERPAQPLTYEKGKFVLTMDAGGSIGAAQVWQRNDDGSRTLLASVTGADGIQLFGILSGAAE